MHYVLDVHISYPVRLQPQSEHQRSHLYLSLIHIFFRIEPEGLADPMTWVFALGQAFFSLSLAGNGTLIYGSYLKDSEDVTSAARKVAFFDTMAALLAALVIIPAMATTGSQLNEGGPGLIFIYLPNLFKSMPGSRILVIVFFTAVFFAGISSLSLIHI